MPRQPRIVLSKTLYHVYNRGLAKQKIYLNDQDYLAFLKRLKDLKAKFDHSILSYVLMPNHFHLLLETGKDSISKIMSSLLTSYAIYFNKRYDRVGTLFQGRFKSIICDKDSYFLTLTCYIHLNPVRDGLATHPADYPWSSYPELLGKINRGIIDKERFLELIGGEEGFLSYQALLESQLNNDFQELEKVLGQEEPVLGKPMFKTSTIRKFRRRSYPQKVNSAGCWERELKERPLDNLDH